MLSTAGPLSRRLAEGGAILYDAGAIERRSGRTIMAVLTMRRVPFGVFTALVVLVASGGLASRTPAAAPSPRPIKIGFIYPDKGALAQLGIDLRDGVLPFLGEGGHKAR